MAKKIQTKSEKLIEPEQIIVPIPKEKLNEWEFIAQVKQELENGYFDIEHVRQAYSYINGGMANVLVMKRAILNYIHKC